MEGGSGDRWLVGPGEEDGCFSNTAKDATGRKLALVVEGDQVRNEIAKQLTEDMRREYLKQYQII